MLCCCCIPLQFSCQILTVGSHKFSTDSRYSVLLDSVNTDFRLVIREAVVTPHQQEQDILTLLLVTLTPLITDPGVTRGGTGA